MRVAHQLRLANRIDGGHHNDFALNQTLALGLEQLRHQVVQGHGARHLIGVNGGLQVNLGARAGLAEAQPLNLFLRARRHAG